MPDAIFHHNVSIEQVCRCFNPLTKATTALKRNIIKKIPSTSPDTPSKIGDLPAFYTNVKDPSWKCSYR